MKMNTKSKILVHLYLDPILDDVKYITKSVGVKRSYVLKALTKLRNEKLISQIGKEVDERKYELTYLGTKYVIDLAKDRHTRGRNKFPPALEARVHVFTVNNNVNINITSKSELDYVLFKTLFEHHGARVGSVGYGGSGNDLTYRFGIDLDPKHKVADLNHRQLIKIWNACYSTRNTNGNRVDLVAFENAIDHLHSTGWFREYFTR